ncbi:YheC/YheD family protein [Alicyclobacillus dauci]|uniref:YheC/YheD family protein n=1 Tax=Alicyclobacillus dauci TaxID=1475485 RepID=A0ABY6Z1Y2_9BACL|nr:YheC/YheD family protein [Alicyclobacillus dauci]WAH36744.1 YheC/YheD family protein [Alicyclobacillus dauci]
MSSSWDPSKWELHRVYSKHPDLTKLLPPTSILSSSTLKQYLDDYRAVYIKGSSQHTGAGIIKAMKTKDGYRYVKVKGNAVDVKSFRELYDKVKDGRPRRSIIVQKAIDLAKIDGRPFSIRTIVMKDGKGEWRYGGMLAKVAGKGSVITNVRRGGGYAATVDDALAQSLGYDRNRIAKMKRKLIRTSFKIIRHARRNGYRTHEAGLDLGIDKKGRIWIIEVNLLYPSYGQFNRLQDKTFYRRIKRFAADYRTYRRNRKS